MELLDTTLRDGSYAINFSFLLSDVRCICKSLDEAGIRYIEVGHGIGLNAGNSQYEEAIHSDEEYLSAAKAAVKNAKIGMFCIPGTARLRDLDMAASVGMDFVRIGTPVDIVESSRPFVEKAKNLGMEVMANYMKSYTAPPEEFAKKVKLSESYGADCVYIVDSSGGMFPERIEKYAEAVRDVSDISLGFHGHNNLGLAISNSLKAVELGFSFVDASLQGLGRSSGNASLEQLVSCLLKRKYPLNVDLLKIISCGYQNVQPLIKSRGIVPIDTISGYADFHTSYMHLIQKYSSKYFVDPLSLIIEVCKIDKLTATPELVEAVAITLKTMMDDKIPQYGFDTYHGGEQ